MSQDPKDPFFGLKYIAYCRSALSPNKEDLDTESFVSFAKWQICKTRNKLWNDPVWDEYTNEEILTEFFAIRFDENEEMRREFETSILTPSKSDLDWFERMESKHTVSTNDKIVGETKPKPPEDFEDKY